ncbi:MAG: radical SAM protein [Burkholderiales bacterium]
MSLAWTPSARLKQIAFERAQPLSASLELTYRCNWRCVFCYNPRHHDQRGLATARWLSLLDELRALGTLYVALTGGEPLSHPEFLTIARGVRERAFALRILTNGALVTEALAEEIARLLPMAVELSLHGARAETHDRTTATPGSFAAMLRGLDRLRERGVPLVLKTPVTRLNEDELDGIRAIADARGIPLRLDAVLTPRDDGDTGPLAYRATPAGLLRLYRALDEQGVLPREERVKGGANCGLGRTTLAIDPEGNLFPCLQWRRAPLGNVRETPLGLVWSQSAERERAAAAARAANDRLAEAGPVLAAFPYCPALAQQLTGDPLQPDAGHVEQAEAAARARLASA